MKELRLTVLDEISRTHVNLPYAAIVTTPTTGPIDGAEASVPAMPAPPPESASRADFLVATG